jgi:phosphoglycolate phosphatase-like HAD superfamily hydrolase
VLSGRSRREALEAAGADLVLEDASRLPAWLPARAGGAG